MERGASFTKGDFSIGAAYTRLNNPNGIYAFDPYAMIGTHTFLGQQTVTVDPATGARTDLFSNTAMDVDSQGTFGIGTSYTIGKLTLDANYSYDDQGLRPVVAHAGVRRWRPVPVHAGAEPHRGLPAHALRRPPLEPGTAGLHYLLSKRTDIYISGDYLRASQGVDAVIGYSFTPSTTQTQADVRIGMRHSF